MDNHFLAERLERDCKDREASVDTGWLRDRVASPTNTLGCRTEACLAVGTGSGEDRRVVTMWALGRTVVAVGTGPRTDIRNRTGMLALSGLASNSTAEFL